MVIHKTQVNSCGPTLLPESARIVKFAFKDGMPFIWYEHFGGYSVPYNLEIVGTGGHYIGKYIGTCFDGPYVWHLVEK